jgi:hypothetical protein
MTNLSGKFIILRLKIRLKLLVTLPVPMKYLDSNSCPKDEAVAYFILKPEDFRVATVFWSSG